MFSDGYLKNYKDSINISFFLILFITFSKFYIYIGFGLKPYMIFSILVFIILIRKFVIHKFSTFEIFIFLFYIYLTTTGLFAEYKEYSLRLILGVYLALFFYMIFRFILSLNNIDEIEKGISISGIIFNLSSLLLYFLGIITLNFNFTGNQIEEFGVLVDRGIPRLIGVTTDPNFYCLYNVIFIFYYITHLDKKYSKTGLLLSLLSILLTFSRSGIVAMMLTLLIYLIFSLSFNKKIKVLLFFPIILFILNKIVLNLFNINMYQTILDRFFANDNGSGRFVIWKHGYSFFLENPLNGIGLYNFKAYNETYFGSSRFMHNTFLEVLVESGVIGFLLFIFIFTFTIFSYYKYKENIKDNRYLILSLIAILIMMNTLSLIINEIIFLLWALIWRYQLEIKRQKVK